MGENREGRRNKRRWREGRKRGRRKGVRGKPRPNDQAYFQQSVLDVTSEMERPRAKLREY